MQTKERTAYTHCAPDLSGADRARALVPIPESQAYLGGIGLTKLYELIKQGELVKVNIGRRGFVTLKSLETYVDRLTLAAVA